MTRRTRPTGRTNCPSMSMTAGIGLPTGRLAAAALHPADRRLRLGAGGPERRGTGDPPDGLSGRELTKNYATSAAGSLQVEIQDAGGRAVPGFSLTESPEIFGDRIDGPVAWKGGAELGPLAGKPIRLRGRAEGCRSLFLPLRRPLRLASSANAAGSTHSPFRSEPDRCRACGSALVWRSVGHGFPAPRSSRSRRPGSGRPCEWCSSGGR